jgi:zinc protease
MVSSRPGAAISAAQFNVRGAMSFDQPGREGTAYLVGVLCDQGTARRDEAQLADILERAGGHISGDTAGVSGSIPSSKWTLLLDLMAEVATVPTYPSAEVARHQQRVIDRLLVERDDPQIQGERLFRELVYGKHWFGKPASGTPESIARVRPSDLRSFHRKHWVGARTLIAFCGDADPGEVYRHLNRRLASWPRGKPLGPLDRTFPQRAVRTAAFHAPREQVHVYLGHLGIERNHPDYPALVVLDHVLGTGPGLNNRLNALLRDKLGLAYTVGAQIHGSAGVLPGVFSAYIGTSPRHVETALKAFRAEMIRLQKDLVPARELQTVLDYLVGSFALGFQRSARRVTFLLNLARYGFPDDYLSRMVEQLAATTSSEVRIAARAHLHPDACCVATAGPLTARELTGIARAIFRN